MSKLVECPNGHGTEPKMFTFVTGEIGHSNYCTKCGSEMIPHDGGTPNDG